MTPSRQRVFLVTGTTGTTGGFGRHVVDELLRVGATVRALTRRPERAALPGGPSGGVRQNAAWPRRACGLANRYSRRTARRPSPAAELNPPRPCS
jgi:NAD(P)-dependent dehydrogenase (short-subunit alcohol dehydrogenase family)